MSFGPDGRLFAADVGQNALRGGRRRRARRQLWLERPGGDPLLRGGELSGRDARRRPAGRPNYRVSPRRRGVSGVSVTGGYLYDGDAIPALRTPTSSPTGRQRENCSSLRERSEGLWPVTTVPVENVGPFVPSFGRDADGELLCLYQRGKRESAARRARCTDSGLPDFGDYPQ